MGLQPELHELGVLRVVVVLLALDARVVEMVDFDVEADLPSGLLDQLREFEDGELLGELVEDAELSGGGRVERRELHAAKRVDDVEEPPRLPSGPIDRQRMSDHRLEAEAVERRSEDLVV